MTKQSRKKQYEKRIFQGFLEKSNFPYEEIIDGTDQDGQPDFFIIQKGEKIGVELVQVFADGELETESGSNKKHDEKKSQKRLSRIKAAAYDEFHSLPIKVYFLRELPSDELGAAQQIAEFSRIAPFGDTEDFIIAGNCPIKIQRLPEPLGRDDVMWSHILTHTGWVKRVPSEFFAPSIRDKALRLGGYRKYSKQVFLLMYVERSSTSGFLTPKDPDIAVDHLGFDKIFLYLHPGEFRECVPIRQ